MGNGRIKSSERTLVLLELFASEQRPMSITEIGLGMKMPQSSTSMLVKSLVSLGYLSHDSRSRTYYPTLRVTLLGTWLKRRHATSARIPQLLFKVAEQTGESTVLAMRNGIYAQYALSQDGPDPLRLHVESGQLRPLACCATGWALMSFDSEKEIGKIIRRTQAEAPRSLWQRSAADAAEQVQLTRQRGYAYSNGSTTPGAGAISILLPASTGTTPLAAAVGGPSDRIEKKKDLILSCLNDLARSITTQSIKQMINPLPVAAQ